VSGRGSWRSICGASPGYLCIDTSLDPDRRARVMAELRMPGLEQVLSDDGKFELSGRPPSQMQGRRTVAVYQLGWQSAHIAVGLITLQVLWAN